jgi:microcin C transport system substrate-binding protein
MRILAAVIAVLPLILGTAPTSAQAPKPVHGVAMHGAPKYGPDFTHFDYVNPNAPKGGEMRLSALRTFNTFNPYVLKGDTAAGVNFLFESLTTNSEDEAFTQYGLLAESITMPKDRSWVAFTLRPEARWHDGKPVTVEDVIWSLTTLRKKGRPFFRFYYRDVVKAEKIGPRTVKFTFKDTTNRELPLILGELPVLPKHYWADRDFEKTILDKPLGSGPYRIESFEPGRSVTYERVKDYWGANLPVNKGKYNANIIRYDYYRDATIALEAFKSGDYDFRLENTSKVWATGYDSPSFRQGLYETEEIRHQNSTGMQGFVFNTRKAIFKDPLVRQALAFGFDFEWTNKNLFYGQYTRTSSYFSNSELASSALPAGEELAILNKYRGRIPDEVFGKIYQPPSTDGTGRIRGNLRKGRKLLRKAGWVIKDRKLVNAKTGQGFAFEILLISPAFERVVLPFKRNLKRLGIDVSVRTVDTAQYRKRTDDYDFDMLVTGWGQSLSPGNEQQSYWGSAAGKRPGSRNLAGIDNPVIDEMIEGIISAPDRDALVIRTRALDRVLLWGHYIIPHWHIRIFRVAFWNKFGRAKITPKYGLGFDGWWVDQAKARILADKLTSETKK